MRRSSVEAEHRSHDLFLCRDDQLKYVIMGGEEGHATTTLNKTYTHYWWERNRL